MADMTVVLETKRYKNVEKYLHQGPLELDHVQSYFPLLDKLSDKTSKWSTFQLRSRLLSVDHLNKKKGNVFNYIHNTTETKEFFIKCAPIVSTFDALRGCYPECTKPIMIPHPIHKMHRLSSKLYKSHNTAYIESLCSVLLSGLSEDNSDKLKISPHFGSIYGIYTASLYDYTEDFTQEYPEYKNRTWFQKKVESKNISVHFESVKKSRFELPNGISECNLDDFSMDELDFCVSDTDKCVEENTTICYHFPLPVQVVIMEKFEKTFEAVLHEANTIFSNRTRFPKLVEIRRRIVATKLLAWMFQISAALATAQATYQFVHNDLHVQNIMCEPTADDYLYYNIQGKLYKVPTHGYVLKIIDFGRSIFTCNNRVWIGDVFEEGGDAEGQYDVKRILNKKQEPNFSFDLSRLACSILEDLDMNTWHGSFTLYPVGQLLTKWTFDDHGMSMLSLDGFDLYIHITKYMNHSIPEEVLCSSFFDVYLVEMDNYSKQIWYIPKVQQKKLINKPNSKLKRKIKMNRKFHKVRKHHNV